MAKNFKALRDKMSPQARERAATKAREIIQQMALDELREARRLTQEQLAATLHVKQSAISKLERRADMYVSTLQRMVRAMGGELEIRARFPEGEVRITQFSENEESVDAA